jgi:hypothetical protein
MPKLDLFAHAVTGELIPGIRQKPRPKREKGERFFMYAHANPIAARLATKRLPGTTLAVFVAMNAHVEKNNVVDLSLDRVTKLCDLSKPQASTAIKQLIELEVIVRYRDENGKQMHMVNPALGWNGSGPELIRGRELWAMRCHDAAQEAKAKAKAKEAKAKRPPLKLVEAA